VWAIIRADEDIDSEMLVESRVRHGNAQRLSF